MRAGYLVGFRIPERLDAEVLSLAVEEMRQWLSGMGVVLEGWDYDDSEGLLLLHLRLKTGNEARSLALRISRFLSENLDVNVRETAISRSGECYVKARGAMPSPSVTGYLLRAIRECRNFGKLSRSEVLSLLLFYLLGKDLSRVVLVASMFGLNPDEIEASLRRLQEIGHLDLEGGKLFEVGKRVLNEIIPSLRTRLEKRRDCSLKVVSGEGGVEVFSLEKLAESLYKSGVSHKVVSKVLETVATTLEGRKYVSKRMLTSLVRSVVEELDDTGLSAARFYSYVYALEKVYIVTPSGTRRLKWGDLRRVAKKILSRRGVAPSSSLVRTLADLMADELRDAASSAFWVENALIIEEKELEVLAESLAPRVSTTWLKLSKSSRSELAFTYSTQGMKLLEAALEEQDSGEKKELILRALSALSSSLLLDLGVLPSNSVIHNLGILKNASKKLGGDKGLIVRRFCTLASKLARAPAVASPRESAEISKHLKELQRLLQPLFQATRS